MSAVDTRSLLLEMALDPKFTTGERAIVKAAVKEIKALKDSFSSDLCDKLNTFIEVNGVSATKIYVDYYNENRLCKELLPSNTMAKRPSEEMKTLFGYEVKWGAEEFRVE